MAWRKPHVGDGVLRVFEPSEGPEIAVELPGPLADESGGAVFPIEAGQGIAMVLGKER
jgi:hypothetical protein